MPKKLYFLTTEIVPFANVTSLAMFSTRVPLALQEKGHQVSYWEYPGKGHAFLDSGNNYFLGTNFERDAPEALDKMINFLESVFK